MSWTKPVVSIDVGDALDVLPTFVGESVDCVVTSPPYWGLRAYHGDDGMIGMERTFAEHVERLVNVFREVRRVLREDGTLWLNYADAYVGAGRPGIEYDRSPKSLLLMPARVAMALQDDGWILRSEIVWAKPNAFPESVLDRPSCTHEKVFLFSKSSRYRFDADAVRRPYVGNNPAGRRPPNPAQTRQPGLQDPRQGRDESYLRNPKGAMIRDVWQVPVESYRGAHFATFPTRLVEPCILAGSRKGGPCSIRSAEPERWDWSPPASDDMRASSRSARNTRISPGRG